MTEVNPIKGNRSLPMRDYDPKFDETLMLITKELRSEPLYDQDPFAEKTAMTYIKTVSEFFSGNVYLLRASQDVSIARKVRTKKWEIEQKKAFSGFEYRLREFTITNNKTRLTCLVNLNGYDYDNSEIFFLPFRDALIILSTLNIDALDNFIGNWLSKNKKSLLTFSYEAIARDLLSLDTTAVLRYFPADNGYHESLAVLGNKYFIENNVRAGVDAVNFE